MFFLSKYWIYVTCFLKIDAEGVNAGILADVVSALVPHLGNLATYHALKIFDWSVSVSRLNLLPRSISSDPSVLSPWPQKNPLLFYRILSSRSWPMWYPRGNVLLHNLDFTGDLHLANQVIIINNNNGRIFVELSICRHHAECFAGLSSWKAHNPMRQ